MPEGTVAFALQGEELIACASGALYWPREEALIVADLHFEKGSAFARRGIFLPPYDTRATLFAIERALARFGARRIIALGDSFHDGQGPDRLSPAERSLLLSLMRGRDWLWILGNHDPALPNIGGTALTELALGPLVLRHEPRGQTGEIAGHLHPCATVRGIGGRARRRCFAIDGARIIVPAFGAYTGGLDVFDPAFGAILARPFEVIVLGRGRAYRIAERRLARDARTITADGTEARKPSRQQRQ